MKLALKENIVDSEFQVVTIEMDPRMAEYTSDEDASSVSRGRTPTNGERSAYGILMLEEQESKVVEKTPNDHRRRTKLLKAFAARRFSSANWMPAVIGHQQSSSPVSPKYKSNETLEKAL